MSASFSIGVDWAGRGASILSVIGEIDMAAADEFESALGDAIEHGFQTALVVDLSEVTFIDSTGLNALVRAFERHRWGGGAFAVVSDDRRVAIMFEVSRLDRVIPRYSTREEALAALAEHSL